MSLQPHSTPFYSTPLDSARLVSPEGSGALVVWQSQTTGKCSIWVTFCNEKAQRWHYDGCLDVEGRAGGWGGGGRGVWDCLSIFRPRAPHPAVKHHACLCLYQSSLSVQRIYFGKNLTISIRTNRVSEWQMWLERPSVLEDCMRRDHLWDLKVKEEHFTALLLAGFHVMVGPQ